MFSFFLGLNFLNAQQNLTSPKIFSQNKTEGIFGGNQFIESIGQYNDIVPVAMGTALYGFEKMGRVPVVFTEKGVVFHPLKTTPPSKEEIEEELREGEPLAEILMEKTVVETKTVRMEWLGANPNPIIIKGQKSQHHYAYGLLSDVAYGYDKIIYLNLYPNIDVEFYFPDGKTGFEYNLIAHPGADLSQVQFKFDGDISKINLNNAGDLEVEADGGEGFIHHAPISFEEKSHKAVSSKFDLQGNLLTFDFPENYNRTETLVVDPWVTALTTLSTNQLGLTVGYDFSGNLYVYGGSGDPKVAKYNDAGVLQWTFNGVVTGWNSGGQLAIPGAFVVDNASGKCYLGQGFWTTPGSSVIRIKSTDGTYDNFMSTPVSPLWEIWDLIFICNGSSAPDLYAGGGNTQNNQNMGIINTTTGATTVVNTTGLSGISHDQVCGVVDPSTGDLFGVYASLASANVNNVIIKNAPPTYSSPDWVVPSGYNTMVEAGNAVPNSPITNNLKALAINDNYLYYYDGLNLKAFNKATGAGVGTATSISGYTAKFQTGIAVDACDNVYIGGDGVVKVLSFNGSTFDDSPADITLAGAAAGKHVFDVRLDETNSMLYVTGEGFVAMLDATPTSNCTAIAAVAFSVSPCISVSGEIQVNITTAPAGADFHYLLKNTAGTVLQESASTTNLSYTFSSVSAGSYIVEVRANEACNGPRTNESVSLAVCNAAPSITSGTSVNFAENGTGTAYNTESTDDSDSEGSGLSYSFTGNGVDEGEFSISGTTGEVTFTTAPDFENPTDVGGNNVYDIEIAVCDSGSPSLCDTQTVAITVTDVNENTAPSITSGTSVNFAENGTGTAYNTESTDDSDSEGSGLSYSFTGNGADEGEFSISGTTGEVTFTTAPDFDNPTDVGGNNVYEIEVQVCDSGTPSLCDTQAVTIMVTDVNYPPNISSGTSVNFSENSTGTVYNTESTDDSDSENGSLNYSFTGTGNSPDEGEFSINDTTGILEFHAPPDFENPTDVGVNNVYDVEIQVCDSGTPPLCDTQIVVITVTDVYENTAPIITSPATVNFQENTIGAVLDVQSTDDVHSEDGSLIYMFTGSGNSPDEALFSIDDTTGLISFLASPDFENPMDAGGDNVYEVEVEVCDSGAPILCATQIVVITLIDENEDCDEDGIHNDLDIDDDGDGEADITDPDDCNPSIFSIGVTIDVKLFLSGNYSSTDGLMYDSLRMLNVLPKNQPYASMDYEDFDFDGTERVLSSVLTSTGNDAIVDWVLLELRSAIDSTVVVATRAAFVQRDGDVVHVDGTGTVTFPNIAAGDYYVVARHRNHLGTMTASALSLTNTPTLIDFTLLSTVVYQRPDAAGSSFSRISMDDGKMALIGGNIIPDNGIQRIIFQGIDADVDGAYFQVLLDPSNTQVLPIWIVLGYFRDDANLDGLTIFQGGNSDADVPFFTVMEHGDNSVVLLPNFVVFEQLP